MCLRKEISERNYTGCCLCRCFFSGCENQEETDSFRKKLHTRFNMQPGGVLEHYLGCHFERDLDGSYSINQSQYLH
jgi:aromatic ring-cleaving dioxygenase